MNLKATWTIQDDSVSSSNVAEDNLFNILSHIAQEQLNLTESTFCFRFSKLDHHMNFPGKSWNFIVNLTV